MKTKCYFCERDNIISYFVSDEVYKEVAGENDLCPNCFDMIAEIKRVEYTFLYIGASSWNRMRDLSNEDKIRLTKPSKDKNKKVYKSGKGA